MGVVDRIIDAIVGRKPDPIFARAICPECMFEYPITVAELADHSAKPSRTVVGYLLRCPHCLQMFTLSPRGIQRSGTARERGAPPRDDPKPQQPSGYPALPLDMQELWRGPR